MIKCRLCNKDCTDACEILGFDYVQKYHYEVHERDIFHKMAVLTKDVAYSSYDDVDLTARAISIMNEYLTLKDISELFYRT